MTSGARRAARLPHLLALAACAMVIVACGPSSSEPPSPLRNVLLVSIDTLRADRIGAYGWTRARTPVIDRLAAAGARFDRAYAAAPITLPSHATMLTGRYPPGHGARDNGMHLSAGVPTLATILHDHAFQTAAFVAAFPLNQQFGLAPGFDLYDDDLPRQPDGRVANERPAASVVDHALAWLRSRDSRRSFFVWTHFFEPHAPYDGDPSRSTSDRYDGEIAVADRELGRLLAGLGSARAETLVIVAGDHGEAFGEHGEFAHSIFVYDTTLRVPFVIAGPGIPSGRVVEDDVTLADIAPTIAHLLRIPGPAFDGIDLSPAFSGGALPHRELYAESFAPLVEFGWAPLRSVRDRGMKYIAAPEPELYDLRRDAAERVNMVERDGAAARRLDARVQTYSNASLPPAMLAMDPEAAERLRALGYSARSRDGQPVVRPDPKERRELAARLAQVASGELTGRALAEALEEIVDADPRNAQAHLRLGMVRLQQGDCRRAEPELETSLRDGAPGVDALVALATCRGRRNDLAGADAALHEAERLAPSDPVVQANIGILRAARGDSAGAIAALRAAVDKDPGLNEARFNLALAYARSGKRQEALETATALLSRLPADAPERPEVERLLRSLR